MATTESQNNGDGIARIATGSYVDTGTAAAFDITCGFEPRYVCVKNQTSGDQIEWFDGMTDAHGIKRVAAGTASAITSLGITPLTDGFTVGLDTDINVTSEQLRWIAIG
jgi:hypothetical protein